MVEEKEEKKVEDMTEEELEEEVSHLIGTTPSGDDKYNAHKFLHDVVEAEDTTKLGYLSEEELGDSELTERAYKELELISKEIMKNTFFAEYFEKEAEIVTSTSLSKEAKLLDLSVIQKREISTGTNKAPQKENKGWFKKKNPSPEY